MNKNKNLLPVPLDVYKTIKYRLMYDIEPIHNTGSAHIEVSNIKQGSCFVEFWASSQTYKRVIQWYANGVRKYPQDDFPANSYSSNGITINGLTAGTYYTITAEVYKDNGAYIGSYSKNFSTPSPSDTTPPKLSNIVIDIPSDGYVSATTFTANVTVTDNVGINTVLCIFNGKTYYYGSKSGSTYYFRLDTPTTYATRDIKFLAYDIADNEGYIKTTVTCGFYDSSARPSTWSWTQAEINAFNNKGKISVLTYQRWNAFVNAVVSVAKWKVGSSYTQYDLGNALMTSSSKTLTADRFNKVRYAIGSMNSLGSGITQVSSGDPVYGWYFTQLADRLNSIK